VTKNVCLNQRRPRRYATLATSIARPLADPGRRLPAHQLPWG
jgi:hypothetical protein